MSNKTILIESNNSASKLYTNRQLRKGVIGNQNIKKSNSQWRTDLKYGLNISEGDEITISGTQINLRGEPDASMEFSGGLSSEYNEENALVDNIATIEYGYYFTNNKQYNFNLPMARHVVVGGERWWKKDFALWNGERPNDKFTDKNSPWQSFIRGYPAFAVEGCYKATESQPGDVQAGTTPGSKQVNTVTRWQVIQTTGKTNLELPPSLGHEGCGSETEPSISNGPFSIAHSNEKRLYLLDEIDSFYKSGTLRNEGWTINSTKLLKSDLISLTTREGFQTPSSVAQDLTEQLHEREGQANNWTDDFTDSYIYLHDAQFFLVRPKSEEQSPSSTLIYPGGYAWKDTTKINKFPVSQVSDKMLKIVKTAGGSLLEKVLLKEGEWNDFVADVPENDGWRGKVDAGGSQLGVGYWNNFVEPDGTKRGDTFPIDDGRKLFYENLLCGEIGRHNAFITINEMMAGNSIEIGQWVNDILNKQIPTPEELFTNRNPLKRFNDVSSRKFYNDIVYLNMGAQILYPMPKCDWDGVGFLDDFPACQFGQQKLVTADFWGYYTVDPTTRSPAIKEIGELTTFDSGNVSRVDNNGVSSEFSAKDLFGIRQSKNMVYPINVIATPRAIAQIKKMLWINRKAKNVHHNSESSGKVRNDCKNENINDLNVAELDIYFLDDGASVGVNSPNGFADPNAITGKFCLPCPYACAQCEGLGALHPFDSHVQKDNPAYWNAFWDEEIPSEPFTYELNGEANSSAPKRYNPSLRQGNRNNRLNFKTSWEDEFETTIDWTQRETHKGIYLNPYSIFKFTDASGKKFQHNEWLKPQDPNNPLFMIEDRFDLWDEQEPEMDTGVALAVVYYKEFDPDAELTKQIIANYPEINTEYNTLKAGNAYPGTPDFDSFVPDLKDKIKEIFYNTPFLALIMNEGIKDNEDPMSQYFLPPMIGENFGISHAFMDGEYAKCVTTQRVNPKPYNTITELLAQTDTQYDNYVSRHNPLYYNLYDYQPYCLIGAEDPNIQFGGNSGRFEIQNLHTPLYLSNGAWNDVAKEGDTASPQADEKIASLNNKLAWISTMSYQSNLRGATIENVIPGRGRITATQYIENKNKVPDEGQFTEYNDHSYQTTFFGLPVIPWGELQQDSNEHKVITSQSGVGILSMFVPYSDQDIPLYLRNINDITIPKKHERMSAWYPNTFNDTLFHKMGYEVEQLLPLISNAQSNGFNRSNYNKFVGYDGQNLLDKQENMVWPFTTNGYISGPINIEGQNRNWVGYDTIYEMANGLVAGKTLGWGEFPEFVGILDDRGDSSSTLRKILPPGEIYNMYSMGGLNYMTGTQVTVESDTLVARKQPKKFDYSYLVIYSNLIEQSSNFYGSNKVLPLPAVGYLSRNYSSSDFFYSFVSDFKYTADRNHIINNFDVEIRLPNGKLANLEDNSSIIFKVIKPAPVPLELKPPKPPTKKEMTKEEKEEELYYKSLIS